jgi:hypothetical protein
MATEPRAIRPGHWLIALTPLFALASGCVSTGLAPWGSQPPAPTGVPCQIVANWKSEVMFTPDPARGGVSSPGIAGRLYLFGPKIDFPFAADGSLIVDLFDEAAGPNGQPVIIEEWRIDPATLKRLLVRDFVGWGYTLFLPLNNYRPEGMRGHLKVTFAPLNGGPLYTENAATVFHVPTDDAPVITTQSRQQLAPLAPPVTPTAAVQAPRTGG